MFKCYCGEWRFRNAHFVIDEIRESVCRDLPLYRVDGDKEYCVLHYPSKNKAAEFDEILKLRLAEPIWDFRMVYFPTDLEFEHAELSSESDFAHTIFAGRVRFKHSKFNARFSFFDAKFLESASFFDSTFIGSINFNAAKFEDVGDFANSTFGKDSYLAFEQTKFSVASFDSAKFQSNTRFKKAHFVKRADFSDAIFDLQADFEDLVVEEGCKVDFHSATFHSAVNFANVSFFEADFSKAVLGDPVDGAFKHAVFKRCKFNNRVQFSDCHFHNKTDFSDVSFLGAAHFERAMFANSVDFRSALFHDDVFFNGAKFGFKDELRIKTSQVNFDGAEFKKDSRVFFDNAWFSWHTSFDYAKFGGYVLFKGSSDNLVFDSVFERHSFWGLVSFENTTFDKPESVYFQTVRLRPSWFVNSVFDVRKLNFADIYWSGKKGGLATLEEELAILQKKVRYNTKRLMAVNLRQFADNAEANNRFEEASQFRRMSFEAERLIRKTRQEDWWQEELNVAEFFSSFGEKLKRAPFDLASFLYRTTSFYGESSSTALKWLAALLLLSAFLYWIPLSQFSESGAFRKLGDFEAFFYSLRIMVLQRPEPLPANLFAKGVVAIESVLAPLQLALLALTLRRKFMR